MSLCSQLSNYLWSPEAGLKFIFILLLFVCFALWWNIAFFPAFFKELFENKLVKIMQKLFPSLHKIFGVNRREISKSEIT